MARKLLGFQIADQFGENIQGEENDPSGFHSFRILSAAEAQAVLEEHDRDLLLMPIYEGDVENPEMPCAEARKPGIRKSKSVLTIHPIPVGTATRSLTELTKRRSTETGGSCVAIMVRESKDQVLHYGRRHIHIPAEALAELASKKRVVLEGVGAEAREAVEAIMSDATHVDAEIGLNAVCHHAGRYGGESGENDDNVFD